MGTPETLLEKTKKLTLNPAFSQNFLVDEKVIEQIAKACQPKQSDTTQLVEIGPGAGHLTQALMPLRLNNTLIELDSTFAAQLAKQFTHNTQVINENVLKVDLANYLKPKAILVGNLPYHLTSPILFHTLGEMDDTTFANRSLIEKVVFMTQLEVAERICANPSEAGYSQLSLQLQYWWQPQFLFKVPKNCFYPAPKVDSAVFSLKPIPQGKVPCSNLTKLSQLIKTAFLHRRKTLLNNLKLSPRFSSTENLEKLLEQASIPAKARPQELSLEQYASLVPLLTTP